MLRIYSVALLMIRDVKPLADSIARHDRDQARQLMKSSFSVVHNVQEGSGNRKGTQVARFSDALGSARESLANLEASEMAGYIDGISPELRNRFNHIIGVLVKLTR